jgi:Ca2+-transporting ATPase
VPELNVLRVFVKGAPEVIIRDARDVMLADGSIRPCTDEDRRHLTDLVSSYAGNAYRTLCVGFRDVPASLYATDPSAPPLVPGQSVEGRYFVDLRNEPLDRGVVLQALFGISDPVRPEVPDAVRKCIEAGITVRMLTGDHPDTARKIATDCGILTRTGLVVNGEDFREWSDEHVDRVLPQLQVMARCLPADKLRLVRRLKLMDQIVAVTGDGTNDAPALKEADVGLAMGIAGTDVAKEACDIIILDDNFSSIVQSVKWGRNVYEGVRKFLMFQLTVNICALFLVFIGAVTRYGAPLRAVQLLWVNLIMDTLAALALATEPPTDELLLQKPHGRSERIINNIMWKHIIGHSIWQLAVLLALLYAAYDIPWTRGAVARQSTIHYTIVFNSFVWMQIFNEFNARSIDDHQNIFKGILKSYIFMFVVALSAGLQAIIVELTGAVFKVAPLSWDQWLFCIAMGSIAFPAGVILRMIPVPDRHFVDILQFWNRVYPVRVTRKVRYGDADDEDAVEMIEASLLPNEEALAEIEQERQESRRLQAEENARKLTLYAAERAAAKKAADDLQKTEKAEGAKK